MKLKVLKIDLSYWIYYSYRKGEKEGNIRLPELKQLIKAFYEKYIL